MRIAAVIFAMAAIAVGLVNLRRLEMSARNETIQLLKKRDIELHRKLCGQEIDFRYQTAPAEVARRAGEMALKITTKDKAQYCLIDSEGRPAKPAQLR